MKSIEELKNTVICDDCLIAMKEIPDKSVDMILADLPYGTTACKWDTIIPFEPELEQKQRSSNIATVLPVIRFFDLKAKIFKYGCVRSSNFFGIR